MAGVGVMAEGPVGENGTFLFSARKSYLDLIIGSYGMTAIPRYYNIQSKVTYNLGKHTLLWNSVYGNDSIRIEPGEDVDEEDDENVDQTTDLIITGLTVKSALTKSLVSEMVLSYVRNNWSTDVWDKGADRSDAFYNNDSIEAETTLKYDLTWFLGKHELSGGFSLKKQAGSTMTFKLMKILFIHTTLPLPLQNRIQSPVYIKYTLPGSMKKMCQHKKVAAYAQLRLNPTDRLSLRFGARYDHLAYTDKGGVDPRIGARYRLTDTFSVNASYGIHKQSPSYIMLTAHKNNKNLDYYHTKQFVLGTEWLPKPDTPYYCRRLYEKI